MQTKESTTTHLTTESSDTPTADLSSDSRGMAAIIVASVVFSVFGVAVYVVAAAAWAEIYRQIKPPLVETFS